MPLVLSIRWHRDVRLQCTILDGKTFGKRSMFTMTTWDIGHAISDRDIQLAKYLDHVYSEFPGADASID